MNPSNPMPEPKEPQTKILGNIPWKNKGPGRGQFTMSDKNIAVLAGKVAILAFVMIVLACQAQHASVKAEEVVAAVANKPAVQVAKAADSLREVKESLAVAAPALDGSQAKALEASQAPTLLGAHAAASEAAHGIQEARQAIGKASGAIPILEKSGAAVVEYAAKTDAKNAKLEAAASSPYRAWLIGVSIALGSCALIFGFLKFVAPSTITAILPDWVKECLSRALAYAAGASIGCAVLAAEWAQAVTVVKWAAVAVALFEVIKWGWKHRQDAAVKSAETEAVKAKDEVLEFIGQKIVDPIHAGASGILNTLSDDFKVGEAKLSNEAKKICGKIKSAL